MSGAQCRATEPAGGPNPAKPVHPAEPVRVSFVGAGPGSADLITLRGAQRLAHAQVVLADALADPALRAMAPQARWIEVGKRGGRASVSQAQINEQLVVAAQQHARVVRLKGGDPSIFGRLEEELLALRAAGISCEVVPGVTAACAAAADAQQPLTRRGRGRSVTLVTAALAPEHAEPRDGLAPTATRPETEVHYMAGRHLPELAVRLAARGWPLVTPVTVVSCAGHAGALVTHHTLADLPSARWGHALRPTVVTLGVGAEPVGPGAVSGVTDFSANVSVKAKPSQVNVPV